MLASGASTATNAHSLIPRFSQYSSHPSAVIFPDYNSAIANTTPNDSVASAPSALRDNQLHAGWVPHSS
jgi:hypothetical protein